MLRFANPKLQEYTGYTEEELSLMKPTSIVHPDDWHLINEILDQNRASEVPSVPMELQGSSPGPERSGG